MNDPTTPSVGFAPVDHPSFDGRGRAGTSTDVSWITERNVLREVGDRRTRAVLAIFHARRSARKETFFVPPQIAAIYRLKPADLCWALDALDGVVVETVGTTKGKFRTVRLLPRWEQRVQAERPSSPRASQKPQRTGKILGGAGDAGWKYTMDPEVERTLLELAREQHTEPTAEKPPF